MKMQESTDIARKALAGYEAAKAVNCPSSPGQSEMDVSPEQLKAMLDAVDRPRGSVAEEAAAEELRRFREQYEADKKAQAKENWINRIISGVSILIALISLFTSWPR